MVIKRNRPRRRAEEVSLALSNMRASHTWDNLLADEATVAAVAAGAGQQGCSIGCTAPVGDQADQGDETDTLSYPGVSPDAIEKLQELYRKELAGEQIDFADAHADLPDVPGAKKHLSKDGVVLK